MSKNRFLKIECIIGMLLVSFAVGCARQGSTGPDEGAIADQQALAFSLISAPAGLSDYRHINGATGDKWFPETVGAGGGFIDYDSDGWLDLLLVEGGAWGRTYAGSLRLFRNTTDGSFEDVTADAGLAAVATYGFGVTIADYDNDGDDDFLLTTLYENLLFRNQDGRFEEAGTAAGVSGEAVWSTAAIFFDADRDGWLDLYIGNYVDWSPETDIWCTHNGEDKSYCGPLLYEGVGGTFFSSDGDGTFTESTSAAGFDNAPGKTLGIAELDFNADGWPDLVVANDTHRDLLYRNEGDGTYEEVGLYSGIAFDEDGVARAGMGVDAGDVDNNGKVSVFVANYAEEMIGVFRHAKDGIFVNRSAASKIGQPSLTTLGFGLFLFDPNLDGYLDVFVANGHIDDLIEQVQDNVTFRQAPQLFINKKNGTFGETAADGSDMFVRKIVARGAAYGDVDRDGDQDVLIVENAGPAHLWQNDGLGGNAVRIYLQGSESNRDGIGAKVLAYVAGEPQARRIRTGGSYLSQSEKVATIGLGLHNKADSLIVSWPSGQTSRFGEIPGGQAIRVVESEPAYQTLYAFNRKQ